MWVGGWVEGEGGGGNFRAVVDGGGLYYKEIACQTMECFYELYLLLSPQACISIKK